jgi:sentrin-specific protease 7
MQALFKKPLEKNDKIGKSPMIDDLPSNQTHSEQRRQPRPSLLAELKASPLTGRDDATSNRDGPKQPSTSLRAPTRASRSTRATAPIHDQDTVEVNKFSVTVGLGPAWDK